MLDYLKQTTYDQLKDETFEVQFDEAPSLPLKLVKVTKNTQVPENYEGFSIEFEGPKNLLLPQRLYQLHHEKTGAFPLFLVPVEENAEGYLYQSVFNIKK